MKIISRTATTLLYIITIIVLIASISSAITKKPILITAVRSYSMYPVLERGDLVFIKNLKPDSAVKKGDIIVFTTAKGSLSSKGLIMHRVVGNTNEGYITRGDANDYTDQESGGTVPIKREWIVSKALTIGKYPIKIPFLGYLTLWIENFKTNPYLLPAIAFMLALIIGVSELTNSNKKKKKKKNCLEVQLIYIFSGLTISIMIGASMLATSQNLSLKYEVSPSSNGVIMGSEIGILQVGRNVERPLSEITNKGFFPIVTTINSKDPQINFSHNNLLLKSGAAIKTTMSVKALQPGKYNSNIWIGMFFPFLPQNFIYYSAEKSFWGTLIILSLIPGFPVMIYPFIETKMRRKTIKIIRHKSRRIRRVIPF